MMRLFLIILYLKTNSYALTALDKILINDVNLTEKILNSSHLDSLFLTKSIKGTPEEVKKLSLYRGFYEEGANIENFCRMNPTVKFKNDWEKVQSQRTILANLQNIALMTSAKALALYAKKFNFSNDEYQNMVEGLVGNYCSPNLSLISQKELINKMKEFFETEDLSLNLPSVEKNSLFPITDIQNLDKELGRKNEFMLTAKIFQSFCSWGNDVKNLGLIVPFVRNSPIMAYVARTLIRKKIDWSEKDHKVLLKEDLQIERVSCRNYVCRKSDHVTFMANLTLGAGSKNPYDDVKRFYCIDWSKANYIFYDQPPKIKEIIKKRSVDLDPLLVGQLTALLTGVPEFLLYLKNLNEGKKFVIGSLNRIWQNWAKNNIFDQRKNLLYEEPLSVEVIPNRRSFVKPNKEIEIQIDVNQGEFDRANQKLGKVRMNFHLKISRKFLAWLRYEWINRDIFDKEQNKVLKDRLRSILKKEIEKNKEQIEFPFWNENFLDLIAKETIFQLETMGNEIFQRTHSGDTQIQVSMNFAPFALKYLRDRFLINKKNLKMDQNSVK